MPLGSGAWDFEFWVLGSLFRVSGFGFRVSGFGFRVSGFEFSVSGFGYWVSCSERRGNSLKAFTDYSQRVKARIRPWLRSVCHIRSTAATNLPGKHLDVRAIVGPTGVPPTRKHPPLGPYRRPMARVLRGSQGGGRFLVGEVPL